MLKWQAFIRTVQLAQLCLNPWKLLCFNFSIITVTWCNMNKQHFPTCFILSLYFCLTTIFMIHWKYFYCLRVIPKGTVDNNLGPHRLAGPQALDPNYCRQPTIWLHDLFLELCMVLSCAGLGPRHSPYPNY